MKRFLLWLFGGRPKELVEFAFKRRRSHLRPV